jgi:MerR family copper efflux transcriptional regulator
VSTYTIGEIAQRSGFSTSTLRYYEGIGLVAPVTRTAAGYRVYDERILDRLAFIGRAKRLGCSLDEIVDLVALWNGEHCGPVQRRLHELVTTKMAAAQRQIADLAAFSAQLEHAASQLGGPPVDGPCGDTCACLTERPLPSTQAPRDDDASPREPSLVCTLDAASMAGRVTEWHELMRHATSRAACPDGGVRVEFEAGVPVDEVARLAAAEQACCEFFSFTITVDTRGIALEVHGPEGADDIVASLLASSASLGR